MTTRRHTTMTAARGAAALLIGSGFALLAACGGGGGSTGPTQGDTKGPFVFQKDKAIYRTVIGPGVLRFRITGVNPVSAFDDDNKPLVFFYDAATGFDAGVGATHGFQGELRTQKLKVHDANGVLMGYESTRWVNASAWNPATVYDVTLEFAPGFVRVTVPGLGSGQKDGTVTFPFLMGFGDPSDLPGVQFERNNFPGAVVSDVQWPEGSKDEVSTF